MFELFGKAQNSKKISRSWHLRLSLSVSIKDYIIEKKETNLKGGLLDTLFMSTFWSFMPTFFFMVSPQS